MKLSKFLASAFIIQASADSFPSWPEESTLSLLQVSAEPKHGQAPRAAVRKDAAEIKAHTPVSLEEHAQTEQHKALTKTSAAAQDIARGIKLLRESLSGQYMEAEQKKKETKATYEAQLAEQARQGREATLRNTNLSAQVARLDQGNTKLWTQAKSLKSECAHLEASIQSLEDNISVAQDFVGETFRRLDNASADPVLDVLDELEQSDKEQASTSTHKERLHAIERLSMLGISAGVRGNTSARPEDASNMLKVLNSSLDDASLAQTETAEEMEASFQSRYSANAEKLAKLETTNTALVADLEAKHERQTKLVAAVQLLVQERDQLVTRRTQAAKFWHKISGA